jgi:REP element-mobilizing transposase RayT
VFRVQVCHQQHQHQNCGVHNVSKTLTKAEEMVGKSLDALFDEIEEAKEKAFSPKTAHTAGYMVSVDGNSAPKKVHDTIEEAKAEAERISPSQSGKTIRILYFVAVYEPSHKLNELV